jgi:pullulanase/glycogen debranching enzyme
MGASWDGHGVNFAVFSAHARAMEVRCATGPGLRPAGPWPLAPRQGHRFNPHKLLLDPWAREIVQPPGGFDWRARTSAPTGSHPRQWTRATTPRRR